VRAVEEWCRENNLSLHVKKTKEMIVDFRKQQREYASIHIDGTAVEKVESFKFLGVHITDNLKCSTSMVKKEQQAEEIWFGPKNPHKLLQMHN
jgi:hypothetical protein